MYLISNVNGPHYLHLLFTLLCDIQYCRCQSSVFPWVHAPISSVKNFKLLHNGMSGIGGLRLATLCSTVDRINGVVQL